MTNCYAGVRGRYPSASKPDQSGYSSHSPNVQQTNYTQPTYGAGAYNGQPIPQSGYGQPAAPAQTFIPDSNRISAVGPPPALGNLGGVYGCFY